MIGWSSTYSVCLINCTHNSQHRVFAVVGHSIWNYLPPSLRAKLNDWFFFIGLTLSIRVSFPLGLPCLECCWLVMLWEALYKYTDIIWQCILKHNFGLKYIHTLKLSYWVNVSSSPNITHCLSISNECLFCSTDDDEWLRKRGLWKVIQSLIVNEI